MTTVDQTRASRRSRTGLMVLGGGAALGAAALLLRYPPGVSGIYPPCPFKALTGLDCPFCGGLRSTHALLTGDFAAAADHNLLVVVAALFGLLAAGALAVRTLTSPGWRPSLRWSPTFATAAVSVLAVFWVVRNLPFVPYLDSGLG